MSLCKDLRGNRYNMLVVLNRVENSRNGQSRWECICDCGEKTIVSASNLKLGAVKSCGCLIHQPHNTHHLSNTRLYNIWFKMKQRCYDKRNNAYRDYGGRGITICDEWKDDFECFYSWSMENGYDENLSIDRIDNDKGYSPQNCRWANPKEQANNRRNCVVITFKGKTMNLSQWCKELNLPYKTIHSRIYKKGWSYEKALSIPIKSANKYGG